jgi:hypothetical protein
LTWAWVKIPIGRRRAAAKLEDIGRTLIHKNALQKLKRLSKNIQPRRWQVHVPENEQFEERERHESRGGESRTY